MFHGKPTLSDQLMMTALPLICATCEIEFGTNMVLFAEHMAEHSDAVVCVLCERLCDSGTALVQHMQQHQTNVGSVMSSIKDPPTDGDECDCPLCDFVGSSADIELHFAMAHEHTVDSQAAQSDDAAGSQQPTATAEGEEACPFCGSRMSAAVLQEHVQLHLIESESDDNNTEAAAEASTSAVKYIDPETRRLQLDYGMDDRSSYERQGHQSLEAQYRRGSLSLDEYHERRLALCSEGRAGHGLETQQPLQGLSERVLAVSSSCPDVARAQLATGTLHFQSAEADRGFGCGYRNLQMLLSCLAQYDDYRRLIWPDAAGPNDVRLPSVPRLQSWIEAAWAAGFDSVGAEQLGNKLTGTRKWIGATEVVALLSSLGIRCEIFEFTHRDANGNHPRLFSTVGELFDRMSRTDGGMVLAPIYCQYQGHSVTIVGVEHMRKGEDRCFHRLLVFDPRDRRPRLQELMRQSQAQAAGGQAKLKLLRRSIHNLDAAKYQLVVVTGRLSDEERVNAKVHMVHHRLT